MSIPITTADQLLRAQDIGRCELVRGELVSLILPGFRHGRVTMNIGARLADFVASRKLGTVVAGGPGFVLARDPDTVRAPDVAFVSKDRPAGPARGYYEGAPDLAVEVLSPDDRPGYVREKVAEWLEAGARAVWVVDPLRRTAVMHRADGEVRALSGTDRLRDDDLLPGFELPVREVFD